MKKMKWIGVKLLEPKNGPPTPDPLFTARDGEIEGINVDDVLRKAKAGEFDVPKGLEVRSANIGPEGVMIYFREAPKNTKKKVSPRRKAPRA